jgi:hypothetical protein
MFENRVLRRIFGPKRDEVTGERRRLHNKELYALPCIRNTRWFKYDPDCLCVNKSQFVPVIFEPPCTILVIKSRRLRWAGQVARMGERRGAYRVLVGKPQGRRPLGRQRRRWGIILKWILQMWDRGHGLERSGSG